MLKSKSALVLLALFVALCLVAFSNGSSQFKAQSTGAVAFLAVLWLLYFYGFGGGRDESFTVGAWTVLLVILNGTLIRLILAWCVYGNYDMDSWTMIANMATAGKNVYAETDRYNYTPLWFTVLGLLKKFQDHHPQLPLHFVIKSFLTAVDLAALFFVLLIARRKRSATVPAAVFFYLNPVSYLITGAHGQFENLAILPILAGVWVYLYFQKDSLCGKLALWASSSLGMIVKQNVFYELVICLYAIRRWWVRIFLFLVSVFLFFLLFVPYLLKGVYNIVNRVFLYSSENVGYGIGSLLHFPWLKYAFILSLFVYPYLIRKRDLISQCLLGFLFFLTFATAMASQYFVLPIAFGALRPTKGFFVFTLVTSLFIMGAKTNIQLPALRFLYSHWNVVWAAAIYWFFVEHRSAPVVEFLD